MENRFIPPRSEGAAAPAQQQYEFGPAENEVFRGLSRAMRIVAIVTIIFGGIELLHGFVIGINVTGLVTVGQGVVMLLTGAWLVSAAGSLADITTTQGADITHLMYAMTRLRSVYVLQAWLIAIACILGVLLVVYFIR